CAAGRRDCRWMDEQSLCQICHHDVFADPRQDLVESVVGLQIREGERFFTAELQRVLFHHGQIGADVWGEIGFVDDEEIGLDHALAGLARNFFTLGDVDDVHREVHEFGTEGGREVVPTRLDEHDIEIFVAALELFDRRFVHRGIFANGGVRAATGFNTDNAVQGQHTVGRQNLGVFDRVDVAGDRGHRELVVQSARNSFDLLSFSCTDGPADANSYWFHGVAPSRFYVFVRVTT